MNRKIIGILVLTLLISASTPSISMSINIRTPSFPLNRQDGVDQEQTDDCGKGVEIRPPFCLAQSFIPTKDKLVGIRLYLYKKGNANGYINITCDVRINVSESNLTGKISEPAWDILQQGTWVMFDFPDIDVTPGVPLYIVIKSDGGTNTDCFCWFYDINNPYDKGEAWISPDNGSTWITLWEYWQYNPQIPEPDFCFITYFKKSRDRAITNSWFEWLFERFPLLERLLKFF